MSDLFAKFLIQDDGAVTVDWVVLTAAVIGLGMIVLIPVAYSTDSSATKTAEYIGNVPVGFGN